MCTEKCFELTQAAGSGLTRRAALLGGAAVAASAVLGGTAQAEERPATFSGRRHGLADLTYPLTTSFPAFVPGEEAVRRTTVTIENDGYYIQEWRIIEHIGTHVDAPGHFTLGGRLSPQITPQELIVPIVVVDIAARAATEPDTAVTVDDLRRFERRHGRIPEGALVCMDSGWADKVDDPLEFKGGPAFPNYHFPGFSVEAAMWLAEERDVTGIGVDTISLDPGNSTTFPVHVDFLATDRYGLENLNNLDRIPPRGATAYVGLIPWEEGSGGPCRVISTW
jgi:kynurenine formamidase